MLERFTIAHTTDDATVCRITVEPHAKRCDVMVTIDRRIIRFANERDNSFRSTSGSEWHDIAYWEAKAASVARAWSPFWHGNRAS